MKIFASLALVGCLWLTSFVAQADTLPSTQAVRQFADSVMANVGEGNFQGTMVLLKKYLSVPPDRVKEMDDHFSVLYSNTLAQLGSAMGAEFVHQGQAGDCVLRLVYLAKYQRSATRWILLFYKREDGWVLNDIRLDANLDGLFVEQAALD